MSQPAAQPALTLTSLPAALSSRIMRQLPLADRVRSGGVNPAWRAVAHAPSLYGQELVLRHALDAPRTVDDATQQRRASADSRELRCTQLRVCAALARGARRGHAHGPGRHAQRLHHTGRGVERGAGGHLRRPPTRRWRASPRPPRRARCPGRCSCCTTARACAR
jgi:hypothetical protein